MTPGSSRRGWILGVLLCATLAATVWVSLGDTATDAPEPALAAPEAPRLPSRREAASDTPRLHLDRLSRRVTADPTQNAFANRSWVTPPPPVQEAPPAPPTAPALPFTYMGKMQEGESGPVTVYLVQGEQAYSVKKGDVIDKTYRVESITADQIVMTYLPMAIKQTLTFGNS